MGKPLDIVIRGDGIIGCTLALALAPMGLRMGLVAGPAQASLQEDVRAYSLNAAARQLLERLGAWPDAAHVGPVKRMAVWGDAGGEISFEATAGPALSWIVEVRALEALLREQAHALPQLSWLTEPVEAELTAICEGRASQTRRHWGVPFERQPYPNMLWPFGCAMARRIRAVPGSGSVAKAIRRPYWPYCPWLTRTRVRWSGRCPRIGPWRISKATPLIWKLHWAKPQAMPWGRCI